MRSGLLAVITLIMLFSTCLVRADSAVDHQTFLQQKLVTFGLAGTPWENESAFDEERSRAWMDALHHAYEKILELPLMEGKLVRHVLQTNPALKQRLGMILLSAEKSFYQPDATGLLRCRIEVPLFGKLSLRSALYLAALRPQSQQPVSFLASWTARPKEEKLPVPECRKLVVDVRQFYFEPSLFPRFFDSNGTLLFQESMIPQPERFSRPAVKFAFDTVTARESMEEGEYFYVSASVHELAARDVTIADVDAKVATAFCEQMIKHPNRELEIVIVYDPAKKPVSGKLSAPKPEKSQKKDRDSKEEPGANKANGGLR